jgi:hypothetical protein
MIRSTVEICGLMTFKFSSIVDYGMERSTALLTQTFANYFVPIAFDAATLLHAVVTDSVDLHQIQCGKWI